MVVSDPVTKRPAGRSRRAGVAPFSRYVVAMVDPALVEKATSLAVDERLELIGKVWDSIATRPAKCHLVGA